MYKRKLFTILKGIYSHSCRTCKANHLSTNVSLLQPIAPHSPAMFLYRYYVLLCPRKLLKLWLMWIICY